MLTDRSSYSPRACWSRWRWPNSRSSNNGRRRPDGSAATRWNWNRNSRCHSRSGECPCRCSGVAGSACRTDRNRSPSRRSRSRRRPYRSNTRRCSNLDPSSIRFRRRPRWKAAKAATTMAVAVECSINSNRNRAATCKTRWPPLPVCRNLPPGCRARHHCRRSSRTGFSSSTSTGFDNNRKNHTRISGHRCVLLSKCVQNRFFERC